MIAPLKWDINKLNYYYIYVDNTQALITELRLVRERFYKLYEYFDL